MNICVIRKGSVEYIRPYGDINAKGKRLISFVGACMSLNC